jgi:hypothetical protein
LKEAEVALKDEIAALRKEFSERPRVRPQPPPAADQHSESDGGIEAILTSVSEVVDELGQDVDKFPRLSAIAAFGLGLALGAALGRQIR